MTTDAEALNEQLKQTAAIYNGQNTGEDAALIEASKQADPGQGSKTHSGEPTVRPDTPEEAAAAAAKKEAEEKAAAEKEAAEKEAEAKNKQADPDPEDDKAKKSEDTAEWITTDSKELNAAINLMKKAGVTASEADAIFGAAVNNGDLSKVDEKTLVEKVGQDAADLILSGLTTFVETEGRAALERTKSVQDAVGGKDNWAKMTAWARDRAKSDPAFKAEIVEINNMMNGKSEFQAKLAAQAFKNLYEGDSNNSSLTTGGDAVNVAGVATAPATSSVEALTSRQYAEGVEIAQRDLRGAPLQAKLRELSAGRAAGRKRGM